MAGFNGFVDASTLHKTDVVDDLTSTATEKPLSANMGKALNAAIEQSTASDWSDLSDYFGTLDQGGDSAGTIFRFGKLRVITMRGLSRSHTQDEVIATLPAADAPTRQVFAPTNIGTTNGIIRVGGNGVVTLYGISGTASNGRIFFNIAYVVN